MSPQHSAASVADALLSAARGPLRLLVGFERPGAADGRGVGDAAQAGATGGSPSPARSGHEPRRGARGGDSPADRGCGPAGPAARRAGPAGGLAAGCLPRGRRRAVSWDALHGLRRFSERFECGGCGCGFVEPQPRLFSFNNPFGACPACHGFGNLIEVDLGLVVPDTSKSLAEGAIEPWNKPHYRPAARADAPFRAPTEHPARRAVVIPRGGPPPPRPRGRRGFPGVARLLPLARGAQVPRSGARLPGPLPRLPGVPACRAARGCAPRRCRFASADCSISDVCALTVRAAREFLAALQLAPQSRGGRRARARRGRPRGSAFLADVGLDYLNLDRPSASLSGGESQRIALASALGTGLVGTLFVLDEPSVGLHPRDTERLIGDPEGAARPGQHRGRGRARSRRSWPRPTT